MKRKVKFQEGGAVEEPARRPTPRSRISRMSEAARNRAAEVRAAAQREVERLNAMRDIEDFNRRVQRGTVDAETMRRMGAQPMPSGRQDFTTSPEGVTRRGTATGREVVPFREPGVPATQGGRAVAPTPRQIPLFPSGRPQIPGPVASAARRLVPGLGVLDAVSPTSLEAGAEFERAGLAQAREEARMQDRATMEQEQAEAPQRMPTPRPAPAPRRRPIEMGAGPEASMARLRREQRQPEMSEADVLNQRELDRIRAEREAEERGAAFKKGGMVKPKAKPVAKKAGGMIGKPKAAPKKMMKGGAVAKPKSKGKPMPFKKGGVIKKGRK